MGLIIVAHNILCYSTTSKEKQVTKQGNTRKINSKNFTLAKFLAFWWIIFNVWKNFLKSFKQKIIFNSHNRKFFPFLIWLNLVYL